MKRKTFLVLCTCITIISALYFSVIPVSAALGIPDKILDYIEANGMDWMNNQDVMKAMLATGVNSVDGAPLTDAERREIEAYLGISSSSATSGTSTPAKGQTEKPAPAVQKHEHTYSSEITKEPTCTEPGEETFTCGECAASYVDEVARSITTMWSLQLKKPPARMRVRCPMPAPGVMTLIRKLYQRLDIDILRIIR